MSPVDVVWEPFTEGCARGFWDMAIIERLLSGLMWRPPAWPGFTHHDSLTAAPEGCGAVVVVPARHHVNDVDQLNDMLAPLPWVLLILTGDEEHAFPVEHVQHPNMRVWVQTPDPSRTYPPGTRFLVNGPTPAVYLPENIPPMLAPRPLDVAFAGQVTHSRRVECVAAIKAIQDSGRPVELVTSDRFAGGVNQAEYLKMLASAKVAPCPSGPQTPDTFRFYEALQMGCLPIIDGVTPRGPSRYWDILGTHPFLVIRDDWGCLPSSAEITGVWPVGWPQGANCAGAWWLAFQRRMARDLLLDLGELTGYGQDPSPAPVNDQITVLMPTSPIGAHPDTAIIDETITSIRAQLPAAEILVMCDGVRAEQAHYRPAYEEYLRRLVWKCRHEWSNVLPIIHGEHLHQAEMTRRTLDLVTTPTILFAEHDCPVRGSIPWQALIAAVRSDRADVVRLHHEATVLPVHEYLMLGPDQDVAGARMRPTKQWSARPHVARTAYYRRAIADHFAPGEKSMLEDRLHGVAQSYPLAHRIWILTEPNGEHGIKYSWHLDGRGTDEKWVGE